MRAAAKAFRQHLEPWDAKQFALKVCIHWIGNSHITFFRTGIKHVL